MMNSLRERMERYLLESSSGVQTWQLCGAFGVSERDLRAKGSDPGLLTGIAISTGSGYVHVSKASREDYIEWKHRIRKHAIAELRRVRETDMARSNVLRRGATGRYEADSGQGVMDL